MAVSGRKLSDFQGSVSLGSSEDFDLSCQPCLTIGQHVAAHGFCVECQEYLCKTCFEYHKRTKASRNHQLLDKDNVGKHASTSKDSEECTEKCSVHKKEIIKFFCPTHKALGCNDCIILDHRTCKIDYIPDKCADIGDSEEYRDIMKKLSEKMNDAEDIMKKAEVRDKEIDNCHAGIIKEILNFRKEINERLDQLQQKIQKDADKKKSNDKIIIKMVFDECANISSDIKKLQSSLQADKSSRQNGQLYINIKHAESKLKSDEVQKAGENLAKTNIQYSFERNTDLENMLSKQSVFGKLNLSTSFITSTKKNQIKTLTHKKDINVRTKSDSGLKCFITGCAVLPSNKLVLADNINCKLKVVDRQSKTVIEETKLDSNPLDIAVLPLDQIAVTAPRNTEILIMKTAGKLTTVHKIPVKYNCYGITYHQGHLYVVCQNPNSVLVLDTQGNVQNTISLNNDIFKLPEYIVVSEDSRHIYISDFDSNCIVSITLQGDVSAVYKHKKLNSPRGMVMLDDGSLLVCSFQYSGAIHHISGDLKQGQIMIDGLSNLWSICHSNHHYEVYIGCMSDQLKVFSTK
ncbi:uncharacterized protein LOC123537571 [Mercenaria mercenaria]|uniref:uncharacterized protein LOC123537571 n=1 Tax=Mercenaria mercenaria TaxID=6596 RepID=UPI00234EA419|nr:uncharacterized protein LOC123537571 [Mercenaria mercenaria]